MLPPLHPTKKSHTNLHQNLSSPEFKVPPQIFQVRAGTRVIGPCILPSLFPSIRIFPNKLVLWIRWPKYWSFSFTISPSMNIQGCFPLGLTGLISLLSVGLLSLLQHHSSKASILHGPILTAIHDNWKPHSFDYADLSAKWCLCFLIHCLGLR